MDSPQYKKVYDFTVDRVGFKPYYKWIVLNTQIDINTL